MSLFETFPSNSHVEATSKGRPARLTVTVSEAAEMLGISRALAYEAVRRGDIPHIRIGRRVVVPTVALTRLLASAIGGDVDPEIRDESQPGNGHSSQRPASVEQHHTLAVPRPESRR
jgi:excisionase family DNA binding protein